jgi:hypothetical protein
MFGGKGCFVDFYPSGDELFDITCQLERELGARSFFVMDENFLLHRKRVMRMLELMERYDKAWSFYVFSSANVLNRYRLDELVSLGISWVWMGLEGENSRYAKLHEVDTRKVVRQLQSHGIRVLGSSIIGLEDHQPANIERAIEYAAAHETDFHQFMLYTPLPGTPLFAELSAKGKMKKEVEMPLPDWHGQYAFNFHHPRFVQGEETQILLRAFQRDLERNGPSLVRVVRTMLAGWRRYKNHECARIRRRFAWEARDLGTTFAAVVQATRRYFRHQPDMRARLAELLRQLIGEFGWKARLSAALGGPYLSWRIRQEARRLATGYSPEPPTFYEKNYDPGVGSTARFCRSVASHLLSQPETSSTR